MPIFKPKNSLIEVGGYVEINGNIVAEWLRHLATNLEV